MGLESAWITCGVFVSAAVRGSNMGGGGMGEPVADPPASVGLAPRSPRQSTIRLPTERVHSRGGSVGYSTDYFAPPPNVYIRARTVATVFWDTRLGAWSCQCPHCSLLLVLTQLSQHLEDRHPSLVGSAPGTALEEASIVVDTRGVKRTRHQLNRSHAASLLAPVPPHGRGETVKSPDTTLITPPTTPDDE